MADIFISYTHTDEAWAEWIAWTLEATGISCKLQAWDFGAGGNFVLEMQRAAAETKRTIAVLSPAYLKSAYAAPEWAAAFARDPQGHERQLIPVRVEECHPSGLLSQIIHIDLVGLEEKDARERLLAKLQPGRSKPAAAPRFPGKPTSGKAFPGPHDHQSQTGARAERPRLKIARPASDLDKRRFVIDSFSEIQRIFQEELAVLQNDNQGVETLFRAETSSAFSAEVYVNGDRQSNCRVWIGGMMQDNGISYAEGSTVHSSNATNEILTLADGDELALTALMDMGIGQRSRDIDTKRMTAEQAAQYLWSRFLWRLT